MAKERKQRVLWCKKTKIKPAAGTLQDMVLAALARKRRAKDRSEPTSADPNAGLYRLIAQHHNVRGGIAGIFTSYERGSGAVSIVDDPDADQINISQLRPPKTQDGKDREWAEGLLYFYIKDNYIVLIQSAAVRKDQFEDHLSWLLKKRGEMVGPSVQLIDQPTKSVQEMVKKSHVKSINVVGPMAGMSHQDKHGTEHQRVRLAGAMLDGIKGILDGDHGFHWADALDGNIEVALHITYKWNTNAKAQLLLDDIGLAMRALEGVDTELELNNGEKISGSELKLKTKAWIPSEDGVLHTDEAFGAMVKWLGELAEKGHLR